jgi:hypothetical protein
MKAIVSCRKIMLSSSVEAMFFEVFDFVGVASAFSPEAIPDFPGFGDALLEVA